MRIHRIIHVLVAILYLSTGCFGDIAPAAISTSAPTDTPTPAATTTKGGQPVVSCGAPAGWVIHRVRGGDTLSQLALNSGTTVTAIQTANCKAPDDSVIRVGEPLYLPRLPVETREPPPLATATLRNPPVGTTLTPPAVPLAETLLPPTPTREPTSPPPPPTPTREPTSPPPGPGTPRLEIMPNSGPVGTAHVILIKDFKPNEEVTVYVTRLDTFEQIRLLPTVVDAAGNGSVSFASQPGDIALPTSTVPPAGQPINCDVQARGNMGSSAIGAITITQ